MSRYDRGQEPPGTDRLRTRIGAAREVVPWVPHAASGSGRELPDGIVQAVENLPRPS